MRRVEKEIKDKETIDNILKKALICRIGMFDGDFPYIVPMTYGCEEGVLYFHSAREGRKLSIMKDNNKVAFEIDAKTDRHLDQVFKKYTNLSDESNYGFDKTEIRVKLYTVGGVHISRSQARRILFGLEKFKIIRPTKTS